MAERELPKASPELQRQRAREIWRSFWIGLLVIALTLLLKSRVEQSRFGGWLVTATYDLIELHLSPSSLRPVTIIDISDISPAPGSPEPTPRDNLADILAFLSVERRRPRAVGIDVDFAPEVVVGVRDGRGGEPVALRRRPGGEPAYQSPGDPSFFRQCLAMPFPVTLAVDRTWTLSPKEWLGEAKFTSLAANGKIPALELNPHGVRRMPLWVEFGGEEKRLLSLSTRVSDVRPPPGESEPLFLGQFHPERPATPEAPSSAASLFLVDYSALESLRAHAVPRRELAARRDEEFRDHVVLIGNTAPESAADQFAVPGQPLPVPGVFLHACAAYTLLGHPLLELTEHGRIAMDILLALVILGTVTAVRLGFNRRTRLEVAVHRLQTLLTWAVISVVFLAGTAWANSVRLMWDDFLLVVLVLLVHPVVEQVCEWGLPRLVRALPRAWRAVALEPEEKESE